MTARDAGPPDALVRSLVDGPSPVAGLEWHEQTVSTQVLAGQAAARGAPEIHVVLADTQTAGRGRRGRGWHAPPGGSLLASLVLRPAVDPRVLPLLPLLAGLALAEVTERYCSLVTLKWPNDLLVGGRKAAGIMAEHHGDAVVLGIGVNIDWNGIARPADLVEVTSLAEEAGTGVDRWRVLAGLLGVLGHRYLDWQSHPAGFLDAYRPRCETVGRRIRATRPGGEVVEGVAAAVEDDGTLTVRDGRGAAVRLLAGDVEHVRPA